MITDPDIVVVGGGSAGLAVALELQQLGLQTMRDVLVLDAEPGPGGAWRRAWDRLPLRLASELAEPPGLDDLGLSFESLDPEEPARVAVPRAFSYFEDASNLYVYRPARVVRVTSPRRSPRLRVEYVGPGGRAGAVECRVLIDASGHWSSPFVPWVPGMRGFGGRHVAAARLEHLDELDGARVLLVGGGRTAVTLAQLLEGRVESLVWSTRRAPDFRSPRVGEPGAEGSASEPGTSAGAPHESAPHESAPHEGAADAGAPGGGVLAGSARSVPVAMHRPWSATPAAGLGTAPGAAWIPRTPEIDAAVARGLLRSVGPLRRFDASSVELASGARLAPDVVVWATGSHSPLRHLAPLRLRDPRWVMRVRGGWSHSDGRVAIVGDGTNATSADAIAHAGDIARDAVERLERPVPFVRR